MNWLGAAFLFLLSWKIATADVVGNTKKKKVVSFSDAALFQWVNPKSWIVASGAIGAYFHSDSVGIIPHAGAFALLFFLAAIPSLLIWLLFGALLERHLFLEPASSRVFNRAKGLLLAASTIFIVV